MICTLALALLALPQAPALGLAAPEVDDRYPADPAGGPPGELLGPLLRFGDYDGDGYADAYAVRPLAGDRLLKNLGDGTFLDVTERAGLAGIRGSRQALWADYDGDGRLDLYVSAADGSSRLLRNADSGLFEDVTRSAGVAHGDGRELGASWIDYDLDHRLDLHLVTGRGDRVFHNLGRGVFEPVELPALDDLLDGGVVALAPSNGTELPGFFRAANARSAGAADEPADGSPDGGGAANLSGPSGYTVTPGTPGSPLNTVCLPRIEDQAGGCLEASSTPTLGSLYPLSDKFMVSTNGNVGVGILTPSKKLQVAGEVWATAEVTGTSFESTVATGTAPLTVSSTTTVANLSADHLDGLDSTAFTQLGQSIDGSEIVDGSVGGPDLAAGAVGSAALAAGAVGSAQLQGGAVTPDKLGTSGATNGAVLGYNGSTAGWVGIPGADWTPISSLPVSISVPGTYYLAANLVSTGGTAIAISVSDVTIDLMGRSLRGTGTGTAIATTFANVAVRNGSISEFSVGLDFSGSYGSRTTDLTVAQVNVGIACGNAALVRGCSVYFASGNAVLGGVDTQVSNCSVLAADTAYRMAASASVTDSTASDCVTGVFGSVNTTVENCTVYNYQDAGIRLSSSGVVRGCSVDAAGTTSNYGIWVGDHSTVVDSSTAQNGGRGILAGAGCAIVNCASEYNSSTGIEVGDGSAVRGCSSRGNFGTGLLAGAKSTVANCVAQNNDTHGILVNPGSTVEACTAASNDLSGIRALDGSAIRGCTSSDNLGVGISVDDGCTVTECAVEGNGGVGISALTGALIKSCTVLDSGADGIDLNVDGQVIDCTVRGSAAKGVDVSTGCVIRGTLVSASGNRGIETSNGCTIEQCTVTGSTDQGIVAAAGCRIVNNVTRANILSGIQVSQDSTVSGNNCDGDGVTGGVAGILVTSSDCRIDGNNVVDSLTGIEVTGSGNLIIRNSCASNSTAAYTIAGGNDYGQIFVGSSGFSGADPWANFSF